VLPGGGIVGSSLKWLAVVIVVLLVAAGLIAPFVGRAAVRLVKEFFNGLVFPSGVLLSVELCRASYRSGATFLR